MNEPQQKWTETIEANHSLFDLKLKEVWRYKDLVYMFVKRDFVSSLNKPF
jgi:lipopolysaccharide transport system permease protein